MDKDIEKYISVVPSKRQKLYEKMGFNVFFHYGINTFTGKEWGDGKAPASVFNPKRQNTDQWVESVKSAGAQGVILTCKHHDGFCLWPTKTTEYSIKNSPYKNGKGDVVREVSNSCKKFGLKFGVYLSPWDRNSKYYGTEKYNDFYIQQLTELLTGYGDIFCVWLDGACGSYLDGKSKQVYDFDRIYGTIRKLQPDCCISNCGPDIRWVGNEGGYSRDSEWNVVPGVQFNTQNIESKSQQSENDPKMQSFDARAEDLGSRDVLKKYNSFMWYPAEVDVSIRPGWFYHKYEDFLVRPLNNLLKIYYTSVGGNCVLLLNIPPDKNGLLNSKDVKRLNEIGYALNKAFEKPVKILSVKADKALENFDSENLLNDSSNCYVPDKEKEKYNIFLRFEKESIIDKVLITEQCDYSQRVEKFAIYVLLNGIENKVYEGTVIGFKKIALFDSVKADGIRLEITQCRSTPHIEKCFVYEANGGTPEFSKVEILKQNIEKNFRDFFDKQWEKRQERKKEKILK